MGTKETILNLLKKEDPSNYFGYMKNIVKPLAIEQLNDYIVKCNQCDYKCRYKSITYGNPNAKVMIIADYIIDTNNTINYPFFGTEFEKMLDIVLEECDLTLDDIFIINSVNCYPCEMDSDNTLIKTIPGIEVVENCKPFVKHALKIVEPELVLLLGPLSLNLFRQVSLNKCIGEMFKYGDISMMATYSPAYFTQYEDIKTEDELNDDRWQFIEHIKNAVKEVVV